MLVQPKSSKDNKLLGKLMVICLPVRFFLIKIPMCLKIYLDSGFSESVGKNHIIKMNPLITICSMNRKDLRKYLMS